MISGLFELPVAESCDCAQYIKVQETPSKGMAHLENGKFIRKSPVQRPEGIIIHRAGKSQNRHFPGMEKHTLMVLCAGSLRVFEKP